MARHHSFDSLTKKVGVFILVLKNIPEVNWIALAEETSKQLTDFVTWLSVATVIHLYSVKV